MSEKLLQSLGKSFENSPIPFAILDKNLNIISTNDALKKKFGHLINTVEFVILFSDIDPQVIINFLKSEKSYLLVHDIPPHKSAQITLNAIFSDESGEFIGASAVVLLKSEYSNSIFSPADDNECQLAVNRELRERIDMMFSSIYMLAQSSELDRSLRVCEYINVINQNCFQLLRVSDNLARVMRLSVHNDHLNFRLLDFSQYLSKLISTVIHFTNNGNIPISFSCPDQIVPVQIDLERMEFAIVNIILNSLKYTRDGNEVNISLKCVGKDAVVTISDKGLGIPKNILNKVDEPYFSYSPNTKIEAGFGIGLFIAKKYISAHAGLFSIQSTEGEGTTVTFTIPIDFGENDKPGGIVYLNSPPVFEPGRKFSQTMVQLSEICSYPAL